MASRAEQKARTRNALIDSWLRIIGSGANFASISLREVAKTAGVVPTSFYRHFGDMDDLGLAVVDQLGLDLRRMMRETVPEAGSTDEVVRECVDAYERYVLENAELVEFINQARTGGTPALRQAIGSELDAFAMRIGSALPDIVPGLSLADRDTVANLILAVLLESAADLMDVSGRSDELRAEAKEALVRKVGVILLGAGRLAEGSSSKPRQKRAATAKTKSRQRPTGGAR